MTEREGAKKQQILENWINNIENMKFDYNTDGLHDPRAKVERILLVIGRNTFADEIISLIRGELNYETNVDIEPPLP